jgi:hypothetical protein
MDMVGGLLSTTKGTFHLSRTAGSLPHVVNVIAGAWFEHVVRASAEYAERGGKPSDGLVWLPGSREAFLGDVRALEMGSDHEVFQDSSFAVPMVYFHDWPDVTIHTNKDQPENLDATKLGRVAYMGAGIAWTLAALPSDEAGRLLDLSRAQAEAATAMARARGGSPRDVALRVRQAAADGDRTLQTLAELWPALAAPSAAAPPPIPASESPADRRVPERARGVRGPVSIYYFDLIAENLGPDAPRPAALLSRRNGEVLAFEALNLADGKRTVSDVRDTLSALYEPVPVSEVAEYFELLARAKAVTWR